MKTYVRCEDKVIQRVRYYGPFSSVLSAVEYVAWIECTSRKHYCGSEHQVTETHNGCGAVEIKWPPDFDHEF